MNNTNNVLGLYGTSESSLLTLVLNYELATGIHVKWRKSEDAIFEMVKNCLNTNNSELIKNVIDFIENLPVEVKTKLSEFGIEYPLIKHDSAHIYRGAAPIEEAQAKSTQSKKERVWRGTSVKDAEIELNKPSPNTKKVRVYRGKTYTE